MKSDMKTKLLLFITSAVVLFIAVDHWIWPSEVNIEQSEAVLAAPPRLVQPPPGHPEPPRAQVDTTYKPPTGQTIAVPAGGDFQAAINQAKPGDVITLQAGATYTGNFTLPKKAGSGCIVIRSSAPDSSLP